MKTISVDVRHLEHIYGFDLHKFEDEHTYPLVKLMDVLGSYKGTPPIEPHGNTKGDERKDG